jgi:hypothetical protein
MVEEPITMGEGHVLYLLAPSITRFVGWEWVSDGQVYCSRSSLLLQVECRHAMFGFHV